MHLVTGVSSAFTPEFHQGDEVRLEERVGTYHLISSQKSNFEESVNGLKQSNNREKTVLAQLSQLFLHRKVIFFF